MNLFGTGDDRGTDALGRIIADLGEPVDARALVQYLPPESRRPYWGIVLLTTGALHLIYGQGRNWLSQLARPRSPEHHVLTVRLDAVDRIELPPRGGIVQRLVSGPTRVAEIHRRGDSAVRVEVDDDGAALLEEAARRIAGRLG